MEYAPAVACFALPPLSRARSPTSIPALDLVESLLRAVHEWMALYVPDLASVDPLSLIYSERKLRKGKWWTAFTYMGVHGSYQHAVQNLVALLTHGYRPWASLGPLGFYGAFFGGGAAAALNGPSKNLQLQRQLMPWLSAPANLMRRAESLLPLPSQWHSSLADLSERWAHMSSGKLARVWQPHVKVAGCSAGVSSLAGVSFCLTVEQCYDLLRTGNTSPNAWLAAGWNIFQFVGSVKLDAELMLRGADSGVDHAGHLTGFIFGCVFYVITSEVRKRQSPPRSFAKVK